MRSTVWMDADTLKRRMDEPAGKRSISSELPAWRQEPQSPTIHLERGGIFSRFLKEDERVTVTAISGHAWITMEGDTHDHVLTVDAQQTFEGPGLLVIEGIEEGARVQFQFDSTIKAT